jgi:hypothetical protein
VDESHFGCILPAVAQKGGKCLFVSMMPGHVKRLNTSTETASYWNAVLCEGSMFERNSSEKARAALNGNVAQFRDGIRGAVLTPNGAQYDAARQTWNTAFEHMPAIVVQAESISDVQNAVRFANTYDLNIGVISTGHGFVSPADNALLINTSRLKMLHIKTQTRTAYLGAGLLWKEVLRETARYGLAPLLGSSPEVGVTGYTLGGGMGWLVRKHGLALDSVRCFDVVTADGKLRRVGRGEHENPDLFWALKGGGGAFGVVVGMEIDLHPVWHVYGGSLVYPVQLANEVMRYFRSWIKTLPEEMTTSVALMNYPNIPQLPESVRGQSFILVRGCWCGTRPDDGRQHIGAWLGWRAPIENNFLTMPFAQVGAISQDPVDPAPHYVTGAWMAELTDDAIETVVQYGYKGGSSPLTLTEIRYVTGAMARVEGDSAAYSQRNTPLFINMVAALPSAEAHGSVEGYAQTFKDELTPVLTGKVYMNYLEGRESCTRIADAYPPEVYARLERIKAKYDPENKFRYSFNIAPSTSE